ncbi:hypothetical protein HMPREF1495_1317 [Lachnoanaerobaculum sp. MSX33]|nr:hypothetical protein HMPREF1495_1317 [Lachnoanaerobaculum sp. MSX33]
MWNEKSNKRNQNHLPSFVSRTYPHQISKDSNSPEQEGQDSKDHFHNPGAEGSDPLHEDQYQDNRQNQYLQDGFYHNHLGTPTFGTISLMPETGINTPAAISSARICSFIAFIFLCFSDFTRSSYLRCHPLSFRRRYS